MKSSRVFLLCFLGVTVTFLHQAAHCQHQRGSSKGAPPIIKQPVIIDTDVGSFIDDSFAIVYAAQSEELDIRLIVTCTDDTTARAKVVAKLLKQLGRDDIPIGIGIKNDNKTHQSLIDWGSEEDLSTYKGGVFEDGVQKMAEVIMSIKGIVDIIAIGPMTNFPTLVQKYPDSVKNARIKAMAGSINVGYDGSKQPAAEYNVNICPWCMQVLLGAGWNKVTITPLDTCGNVVLDGDQVKHMLQGDSKASAALASTLTFFCIQEYCDLKDKTPILFDIIGTLIAMPDVGMEYMNYSLMNLRVNSTGYTVVDNMTGKPTYVALSWKENAENAFMEMLVKVYGNEI